MEKGGREVLRFTQVWVVARQRLAPWSLAPPFSKTTWVACEAPSLQGQDGQSCRHHEFIEAESSWLPSPLVDNLTTPAGRLPALC